MSWSPRAATLSMLAAVVVAGLAATGSSAAKPGGPNPAALTSPTLAAHACQGDGYLSLTRMGDGSGFKNVGECVSYAAHGGQFSAGQQNCTVTTTTGCLTFNKALLTNSQGDTVTVSGVFSFDSSCTNTSAGCSYGLANAQATGSATYTETDSTATTIASGTLTAADATGEGLVAVSFNASTCSASTNRTVNLQVSASNPTTLTYVSAQTGSGGSSLLAFENQTHAFTSTANNVTIDC